MNLKKLIAVLLIAAGVLGLVYGHISYTKEEHKTKLGPIELSMKDKETIRIPQWLSVAVIAAGVILLIAPTKRS